MSAELIEAAAVALGPLLPEVAFVPQRIGRYTACSAGCAHHSWFATLRVDCT